MYSQKEGTASQDLCPDFCDENSALLPCRTEPWRVGSVVISLAVVTTGRLLLLLLHFE
jgi:hypothetical protein